MLKTTVVVTSETPKLSVKFVRDLRADDADQDDAEPVHTGHVLAQAELEDECHDEQGAGDERRLRQAEVEVPAR